MIRLPLHSFWICLLMVGVLFTFNACEEDTPEPEPPIEEAEPDPNDVRFQIRGGSFGEQNIVFEKTELNISKSGFDENTGSTRLYTLAQRSNSSQNDIIDIYVPFAPGTGAVALDESNRSAQIEDFDLYINGTRQVSLKSITVEFNEYGAVGERIKGRFFGRAYDESIGATQVNINFGEFDMLRTF